MIDNNHNNECFSRIQEIVNSENIGNNIKNKKQRQESKHENGQYEIVEIQENDNENNIIKKAENDNEKNILISLPNNVVRYFLKTWIEVKNICYLDNAFCNKQERKFFLNNLNECVIIGNFCDKFHNFHFKTELYLKWILKRNIFLNYLLIDEWNHEIFSYFQKNINNRNLYLKSLKFNFTYFIFTNFKENLLIKILKSKNFKNLTEFCCECTCNRFISDLFLIAISNNYKNLKILILEMCNQITDHGLIAIASKCLHLEHIDVSSENISDLSLIEISKNCSNLKFLILNRCYKITDSAFILIAKNCLKLEKIDIFNNENITDFSLIEISKNILNLKIISLFNCSLITNCGLMAILKNCLKLESVKLCYNQNITDIALISIANNCLNLKILWLNCEKITENGVFEIVKNCLKLNELSYQNCNSLERFNNLNEIKKLLNEEKTRINY
jgi:hypothetical protein